MSTTVTKKQMLDWVYKTGVSLDQIKTCVIDAVNNKWSVPINDDYFLTWQINNKYCWNLILVKATNKARKIVHRINFPMETLNNNKEQINNKK